MLDVGFVAGLPAPLGCALREVPEAGFAFEAILVVEAIAELSVKNARCGTVAQKSDGVRLPRSRIPFFLHLSIEVRGGIFGCNQREGREGKTRPKLHLAHTRQKMR
jgi:hypothetical protein